MKVLKYTIIALAAVIAAGCVYDYGVEGETKLDKSLVVIEGDIVAGGISEVKVSTTSNITYFPSTWGDEVSTKGEDLYPIQMACQVWVESSTGEVWPGRDSFYVWIFDEMGSRRQFQRMYVVDTRDLPLDGSTGCVFLIPTEVNTGPTSRRCLKLRILSISIFLLPLIHLQLMLSSTAGEEKGILHITDGSTRSGGRMSPR